MHKRTKTASEPCGPSELPAQTDTRMAAAAAPATLQIPHELSAGPPGRVPSPLGLRATVPSRRPVDLELDHSLPALMRALGILAVIILALVLAEDLIR